MYDQIAGHDAVAARMISLMMLTCIRVENIVEMQWDWINFDKGEILTLVMTQMSLRPFRQPMLLQWELLWNEYAISM